ncbi:S1 family peptidase [Streptomyces sp. DSM 42041]|uniref:S1 family peptidase n=1 Tax=Streptomyces hazeniae TaxID=3075538 RepID=A0ABU2P0X8_9ACTN|nr:S1 family peptidase [Streptomyces sp. DSM 42041]MDT0382669.1 S1 family peptidase [Streptomyces sp. DSM 42041]
MDKLAGIPNTSWGIDPSSNQVVIEMYDDVSAADEARIRRVAAAQGDAVRVEQRGGTLQRTYDVRGGIGIHNDSYVCSAGFNVTNSAGKRYLLTAGHCMTGGTTWYRRNGSIYLGVRSGDFDNGEDDTGDWGLIEYKNPDVRALGMVQYKDGSASQITRSRYVTDGETAKRVGTMTQDLIGMVLQPVTTVTYSDGTTLTNMIKTSHCSVNGDSGGPLFAGDAALGLVSGGNYVKQPCGDSDGQDDRVSWHTPVQRVLDVEHPELSVY